ncbi:Dihydrodipicolinate reductase [Rhynchospora pubera]|uniref:Dihydrodipicolinate reductase n=1 Tax=Rhynchospora pubera TaxID=906938 RepID=A0AAV8H7Y9_9POAL|nr:Dihydrodipicolinate reductase [Rhynchospora pubera]
MKNNNTKFAAFLVLSGNCSLLPQPNNRRCALFFARTKRTTLVTSVLTREKVPISQDAMADSRNLSFPILVNGVTGKMGKAVAEISVHGTSERDKILSSVTEKYPDVVVVDYTVPNAVNVWGAICNGYNWWGSPMLHPPCWFFCKTVQDSNVYAVISPQMGKQVVAFLAAMEIMAEQFPGAFSGYKLEV